MNNEPKEEKSMKTVLHTYYFDTDKPGDREPCHLLHARLMATPGRGQWMRAIKSNEDFDPQPGMITLETEHLFQNQWNADVGRVFDWYEEYLPGRTHQNIKRGHYLDISEEMIAIRANTLNCRYTGQQFDIKDFSDKPRFNTTSRALGSAYLKESELYLCRLLPVCDASTPAQLTDAERDYLLPLYIAAQTKTNTANRAKQLEEVQEEFAKATQIATTERDGKLWLLSKGIPLENCIYYTHTNTFCFGWRNPFTGAAREALQKALDGFPFPLEFK